MRVVFWHSSKPRERILAEAFLEGLRGGDEGVKRELQPEIAVALDCDVAVMVGVKSRELFHAHARAGLRVVMLDKGYSRHKSPEATAGWEYWRVAVGAHHPTRTLMSVDRPADRWDALGFSLAPWRGAGAHIVFAGSSAKYHEFYGLKEPTSYASKLFKQIRGLTGREIVYRPKPSWKDATPIAGTRYSDRSESIHDALKGAHALVTHGSNACFEAVMLGIPCIILGDAVAKPISSTDLAEIESPRLATMDERRRWAHALAYQQFTLAEFSSGLAWSIIRPQIYG